MKNKRGFTLIELIVVVALIGVAASIVIANTGTARSKGRDTRRVQDLQQLHKAIALYQTNGDGDFPVALSALVPDAIGELPKDPVTGNDYAYYVGCGSFHLGAILELEDDSRLLRDADAPACESGDFDGYTENCTDAIPGSTEKCFDIKP